jgi:1-acyl-sn-glycerol-3-phosphate acyltransferase
MLTNFKILRLGDLIFNRRGAFGLRLVYIIFGIALTLFFRRIELVGADTLPSKSGLIFVSNHPNALIDPALVFVTLPRRIAFLAKSTLFKIPIFGFLIRVVGALPLYRQQDAGADVSKNQETFAIVRELLKTGGAVAMFPEGVSHNAPKLLPLKTGAARIALGTVSVGKNPASLDLKIVPVGLFYTNKTTFRSEALLRFGEPISVSPVNLDADGQPPKESVKELTRKIEDALREVTVNAESDTELETARIAGDIFISFTKEENIAERQKFLQNFVAESFIKDNAKLGKRLAAYDKKLNELGIESEFLAFARFSKRFVFKQAVFRYWFLILLLPLAFGGAILHLPAYQFCKFLAYLQTRKSDFDMASTAKVLAGMILMPLTWTVLAGILYFYWNWKTALVSIPVSFLCGYAALRTLEEIEEMRGWIKAIRVFFNQREKFLRLLAESRNLHEKIKLKVKSES